MYYDRAGHPISLGEWARLRGIPSYHRVDRAEIGSYVVSTVWLGLDHGFSVGGPPIIFETMVFASPDLETGMLNELEMRRYATEEEARRGHEELVTLIRATVLEDPDWDDDSNATKEG